MEVTASKVTAKEQTDNLGLPNVYKGDSGGNGYSHYCEIKTVSKQNLRKIEQEKRTDISGLSDKDKQVTRDSKAAREKGNKDKKVNSYHQSTISVQRDMLRLPNKKQRVEKDRRYSKDKDKDEYSKVSRLNPKMEDKRVKILFNNINAVKGKEPIIQEYVIKEKIDILGLVETKRRKEDLEWKIAGMKKFEKFRNGKKTGGIVTWVKQNLNPKKLQIKDDENTVEGQHYVWVTCGDSEHPLAIGICYWRGQDNEEAREVNNKIAENMIDYINWARKNNHKIILLGDFNAWIGDDIQGINGNWPEINRNGRLIRSIAKRMDLTLYNNSDRCTGMWTWGKLRKNTKPRILDLVYADKDLQLLNIMIDQENQKYGYSKDHAFIEMEIGNIGKRDNELQQMGKKFKIDDKSNWTQYKDQICKKLNENLEINKDNMELETIIDITRNAAETAIGYKKPMGKTKIPRKIQLLMTELRNNKKELRNKLREINRNQTAISDLIEKTIQLREEIRDQRDLENKKAFEKAHDKWFTNKKKKLSHLYKYMDRIKKGEKENVVILDNNDKPIQTDDQLKSLMEELWYGIFDLGFWPEAELKMKRMGLKGAIKLSETDMLDAKISVTELDKACMRLRNGTASGSTEIPPELIKEWPLEMKEVVCKVFNTWYDTGFFPEMGKQQKVTLLHKKGVRTRIANYRTLSMGCNICKIYLSILTKRIEKITEEKQILGNIQNGFRAGRRIEDCLLILQHAINKVKTSGRDKKPAIAFLDICKAYDRVWRQGIWYKMEEMGFSQKLINAIKESYNGPTAIINFQGVTTEKVKMEVGLRQGCVMSPILFAIYLADLGKEIERSKLGIQIGPTENTDVVSGIFFADDMVLIGKNHENLRKLLKMVGDYAQKWKTEFSAEKSVVLPLNEPIQTERKWKFGRKYISETDIAGIQISDSDKIKYLGFQIRQDKWDIYHKHKEQLPHRLESQIWKTIIPATNTARKIVYGAKIWEVYMVPKITHGISATTLTKKQIDKIAKVEREFLRTLLQVGRQTAIVGLYGEVELLPIERVLDRNWINYYVHLKKLPEDRLVKKVILEQEEWLQTRPNVKTWVKFVKERMDSNGIKFDIKCNKDKVKKQMKENWCEEYRAKVQNMISLKYNQKDKPTLRKSLIIDRYSKRWLQFKLGVLRSGDKTHNICPRCKTENETVQHMIFKCPDNKNNDIAVQNVENKVKIELKKDRKWPAEIFADKWYGGEIKDSSIIEQAMRAIAADSHTSRACSLIGEWLGRIVREADSREEEIERRGQDREGQG